MDIDSFHRGDLLRSQGVVRAEVWGHHKRAATLGAGKRLRTAVVQIGPPGAVRRSTDTPYRAARGSYPDEPVCRHEMGQYQRPLVLGPVDN